MKSVEYEGHWLAMGELANWYSTNVANRNEATTRLQIIDRIFFECLGWDRNDVTAEEAHGGQYADYTFNVPRKLLIVEAKKEGTYFELPVGLDNLEYSIKTLVKTTPEIKVCNGASRWLLSIARGALRRCIERPSIRDLCCYTVRWHSSV